VIAYPVGLLLKSVVDHGFVHQDLEPMKEVGSEGFQGCIHPLYQETCELLPAYASKANQQRLVF